MTSQPFRASRRARLAHATATGVLAVLAVAAVPMGAQVRGPSLVATEEFRIDLKAALVGRTAIATVGPRGEVIVMARSSPGKIVAFDSLGRTVLWRLQLGRNEELRTASRLGWTGGVIWIGDPGFDQIVLLDGAGTVFRSIAFPAVVRPAWGDRQAFPLFGSMLPQARYGDGSLLVEVRGEERLVDTPQYDTTSQHLLRVTESGTIVRAVAKFPNPAVLILRSGGDERRLPIPFMPVTHWAVSADGFRIALARPSLAGADSATIGITMLNERSDTVFSRRYPFTPTRLDQHSGDSSLRQFGSFGAIDARTVRERMREQLPAYQSPTTAVRIGVDRSVWLSLRPPQQQDSTRSHVILDPRGDVVGVIDLPTGAVIGAVARDRVWYVVRGESDAAWAVRARIRPR